MDDDDIPPTFHPVNTRRCSPLVLVPLALSVLAWWLIGRGCGIW